jgi:hypothetical protein
VVFPHTHPETAQRQQEKKSLFKVYPSSKVNCFLIMMRLVYAFLVSSVCIVLFSKFAVGDSGPDDYYELDPARNPATPLYPGATGAEVIALQNALAGVSYPVQPSGTPPSGVFDDATESALLLFQSFSGVAGAEIGFVSVSTMEQFDLMLGIQSCPPYGLARLGQDDVTAQISDGASAVLDDYWNYPIGTIVPYLADNSTYVGRIELHFHPWGGSMKPYGYHHGVSVFYYALNNGTEGNPFLTGSDFLNLTSSMSIAQREDHVLLQLSLQNMPNYMFASTADTSKWMNVTAMAKDSSFSVTFSVLRDYVSVGSDENFVRFPCAAFTAQKLADLFNASVPTTTMVDLIWAAATTKLDPQPISPSDAMCSNPYVEKENSLIQNQLSAAGVSIASRPFISGDKKDTVLTNQYAAYPDSVAEYGWLQSDGQPIQPLYMGHSSDWADYSMGIRLVSNTVYVQYFDISTKGATSSSSNSTGSSSTGSSSTTTAAATASAVSTMQLAEALADPLLSTVLSNEGPIVPARVPVNPRPASECWAAPSSRR